MGRARRGATLLEMITVMFLMGIVLYGFNALIRSGVSYYLDSTAAIEARQQLLFGATRLAKDLQDSNFPTVYEEAEGTVFPTVRGWDGAVFYDDKGRTRWRRYVCYYVEPATASLPKRLMRKEVALPGVAVIPDDLPINPPDPMAEIPPRDVAWFRAQTGIQPKVVVRNLDRFEFSKEVDLVKFILAVSVSNRRQHLVELESRALPLH